MLSKKYLFLFVFLLVSILVNCQDNIPINYGKWNISTESINTKTFSWVDSLDRFSWIDSDITKVICPVYNTNVLELGIEHEEFMLRYQLGYTYNNPDTKTVYRVIEQQYCSGTECNIFYIEKDKIFNIGLYISLIKYKRDDTGSLTGEIEYEFPYLLYNWEAYDDVKSDLKTRRRE